MELWNRRAAEAVKLRNSKRHNFDENVSDLHGLTRKEAIIAADEAIASWMLRAQRLHKTPSLKIVTGAGLHSSGNKPVLLPSIMAHVKRRGVRVVLDDSSSSSKSLQTGSFWVSI